MYKEEEFKLAGRRCFYRNIGSSKWLNGKVLFTGSEGFNVGQISHGRPVFVIEDEQSGDIQSVPVNDVRFKNPLNESTVSGTSKQVGDE